MWGGGDRGRRGGADGADTDPDPSPSHPRELATSSSQSTLDADQVTVIARALEIALDRVPGALAGAAPYVAAAATAAAPCLRRLAAAQLNRCLAAGEGDQGEAATALAGLLADGDASVAAAAESAATAAAARGAQLPLDAVLTSPDARVRLRGLAVASAAAAVSPGNPSLLPLHPLAAELAAADADPLAAAAALAAVADAVTAAPAAGPAALALAAGVGRELGALLAPDRPPALRSQALQMGGALAGKAEEASAAGAGDALPAAALTRAVLAAAAAALCTDDEVSPADEEGALLAVGELAGTRAGADAVATRAPGVLHAVAAAALGARALAAGPSSRIAALHTLATLAGAERARAGGDAGAASLSPAGEAALAAAVHSGAAIGVAGRPPAAALDALLAQPLPVVRSAAARLLVALALRPWGAADACLHPPLLARVTDVGATAATATAEWRHAAAVALHETAKRVGGGGEGASTLGAAQTAALAAALAPLAAAVRAGPHGVGGLAARFVATRTAG